MNKSIMYRTADYFAQEDIQTLMHNPGVVIAAMALRFGITVALRHPEYAQAYYQLTKGIAPEADELEDEVIDDFVKSVALTNLAESVE